MKGFVAAALVGAAAAAHQGHAGFHNRRGHYGSAPVGTASALYGEVCDVYTHVYTGEGVWAKPTYAANTTTSTPLPTSTAVLVVYPTPEVTVCPTPGTYTFPASTIVVTDTTTVCGAATTVVPPGEHTYGGVTTSVVTSTTVTCPYATVSTSGSVTTSVILTTTYVCPSAGEYTFAATTASCSETETYVYPTISTFVPGTYTHDVVTVTIVKTSEVFVCPYETSTKTLYATPSAVASSAPAYTTPAYTAPAYTAPAYTPKAKPSAAHYGGTGKHITNGDKWAMTYTPYHSDAKGTCKSASEVMVDLEKVKNAGFTTVRLYSTDCDGLESVGAAAKAHGLYIIMGVFIKADGIPACNTQVNAIISWAKVHGWSIFSLFVIGNEAAFNGYCTVEELAAFIKATQQQFIAAGCPSSIPFTTAEPVSEIIEHGATLCPVIQVMAANIHAFFDPNTDAAHAGDFVKGQMDIIAKICPEAAANGCYNLESGWPSAGKTNGKAVPGKSEQKEALDSIVAATKGATVVFSPFNDLWKEEGAYGVEQSWGCLDIF